MLSWLFNKFGRIGAPKSTSKTTPVARPTKASKAALADAQADLLANTKASKTRAELKADNRAQQLDEARALWSPQLAGARGDDAALLRIALATPVLDIKLAAVEALSTEDALRQAEREFRSHDRRVHRAAKQGLEACVARRETRTKAQGLIEAVGALAEQPQVPVNRLVALDLAWQALDAAVLDPQQQQQFSTRRTQLDEAMRQRDEQQQHMQRWTAEATRVGAGLKRACTEAASLGLMPAAAQAVSVDAPAGNPHDNTPLRDAARDLLSECPDTPAAATLALGLQSALQMLGQVDARLAWLGAIDQHVHEPAVEAEAHAVAHSAANGLADEAGASRADAHAVPAQAPDEHQNLSPDAQRLSPVEPTALPDPAAVPVAAMHQGAPPAQTPSLAAQWFALPALADPELSRLLNQRFEQWQRAQAPRPTRQPAPAVVAASIPALAPAHAPAHAAPNTPPGRTPNAEQLQCLQDLLQQAEAALADGQLSAMQQQLQALDAALDALPGVSLSDAMRARRQVLQAECRRLKDWQQWGGGRARDDLVAEAESLASLTLAAAEPVAVVAAALPAVVVSVSADVVEGVEVTGGASVLDAAKAVPSTAEAQETQVVDVATSAATVPETTPPEAINPTALDAAPDAAPAGPVARPAAPADRPRLHLKAHADAIQALRKRWRELDRLGAAASQPLWRRFDAALAMAYQPVAAHQALLNEKRQDNLAVREALLATLEALPDAPAANTTNTTTNAAAPDAAAGATPDGAQDADDNRADPAAFWKERLRALDNFHTAWRQLGPLEHTVPPAARSALQQRWRASVDRIEQPLQLARRAAELVREQLIARAQALVVDADAQALPRDAGGRVRELQADWQQHARALPLARAVENALWARFRAACDAVFAQRDAVFNALDAELVANLQAHEALLQRLSAVDADAPEPELTRTLADVDRAWRQVGETPRGTAGAVDGRYRDARAVLQQRLNEGVQKRWWAQCDAVVAKLALCDERELAGGTAGAQGGDGDPALAQRWAALPALPPQWEHALAQRLAGTVAPGPLAESAWDDLLLQLEVALDMPASPECLAARRKLKLRALKDAMEGRATSAAGPTLPADCLAAVLRQAGNTDARRERLRGLTSALKQAAPGTLQAVGQRG